MQNRIERYSRIRRWLGRPDEQSPSPDDILSQMLVDEQSLLNRLTNTGQPWSLIDFDFTSVAGKSEYDVSPFDGDPGKVYFVYRQTNHPDIPALPIEFEEFNQLPLGKLPTNQNTLLSAYERISFYRLYGQEQQIKAVIKPTPVESNRYKVYFHTGQIDRSTASMSQSSILAEFSDYLDLKTAIALLPYTIWLPETNKENRVFNQERRKEIGAGLIFQLQSQERIFNDYIENINSSKSFDMDCWNEN